MLKVAIVGKPNVGKSTLFNRIIGYRKAIVADEPGVTRDRIIATTRWLDREIKLIDTGGLENENSPFQENIKMQVEFAVDEADVIIFLTSQLDGVDQNDRMIAKFLKKYKAKNIILVVNKNESNGIISNDFYSLGFSKPFSISANHGLGIGDLLDLIVAKAPTNEEKANNNGFTFCIIGKPNAGKSTLLNAIANENRAIVSEIANTTRDSIDYDFMYHKEKYTIIDTAGIRRKGKVYDEVEKYAVLRAYEAIERSQLAILVIDGNEPFTEQDEVIGGLIHKANIPAIIAINKWDKVDKDNSTMNKITKLVRTNFNYLSWAPIIFISAKNNERVHTLFSTIEKIRNQVKIKVSTSMLNDVIMQSQITNQPPLFKGGRINLSYATQIESQIPSFVIFCNNPNYLHFTYARYIENRIRESFGIDSVPIMVYYKDKNARNRKK